MTGTLDHLVYAVPNLEAACDWFEEHTGIRPAVGGRHPDRGTHNAVVNLGEGAYLEIIAADPKNTDIPPPRWMGVDLITQPTMTRWAVKSDNLDLHTAGLAATNAALGQIVTGNRDLADGSALRWRMTLPAPEPAVELLPFFLDWSTSSFHPTERMGEGFTLLDWKLYHPHPEETASQLELAGLIDEVAFDNQPVIKVRLNTPRGVITLR